MGQRPIAIVGIGCRFPGGVKDPVGYWDLLKAGRDAITDVPETRWSADSYYDPSPGLPGKSYTRRGGFLDDIEMFDPGFFGISPREATRMDPQQRQVLEVAWEALEDAGHTKEGITGSDTGVFIGISSTEYATIQTAHRDLTAIDTHSGTGSAMSIAANRISYCFNLRGPSLALDTACSSSLVAVHLACESIHRGECSMALAGGVNAILKPDTYVIFASASMLSADGKCRTFDAGASGFVRGEGAGVLVLKPLDRAIADNDRIYAVVRGTATNQDGRSSGLTVPDQGAQEEMLRQVCARADVSPEMVQYVEAHGTGTMVGDPVEAIALGNIFGRSRANGHACIVGSVKTNIGHLEPASGIAGMIKVALALQHEEIPANLHFKTPNPHIPFEELKIRVPTEHEKWPEHEGPALAGVNSFGFGGANASAILSEAPANGRTKRSVAVQAPSVTRIVPLTARSKTSLQKLAAATRDHLIEGGRGADASFDDICWSSAMRRSHHEYRLAVIAQNRDELIERLGTFAEDGESRADAVAGRTAHEQAPKIAFVLSGQGPQWWAMGRELFDSEPVFRRVIEDADEIIREIGSWSLVEELLRDENTSRMQETSIAQPAIFALQVGLARLWSCWGIEPEAVVGHSVGEVAAAHLAGALSFEDAVRVIFHRGRCMDFADAHGQMLAVGLPFEEAQKYVDGKEDKISLAAINSPDSVTLSGDGRTLERIAEELEKKDIFNRFLKVNYAFHSPMMDPMREELLDSLKDIEWRPTTLPMYSTVTGSVIEGTELGPEYWWKNVRHSVWFSPSIDRLIDDGYDVFLELAPHPVLSGYVNESLRKKDATATVAHSLRRGNEERPTMLKALATLYTVGCRTKWDALVPEHGEFVSLPRYRWDHSKYWSESEESRDSRIGADIHPLLGHRLKAALPTWEKNITGHAVRYLSDHCVQGQAILPGTSYLELAAIAARELHGPGHHVLENIDMSRACFISDEDVTTIQVTADPSQSMFRVMSRVKNSSDPSWTAHVTGKIIAFGADDDAPAAMDVDSVRARCLTEFSAEETYPRLTELGLEYGPAFQGIEKLWAGDGEALAWIVAPEQISDCIDDYELHPAMLDACLQTLICAIPRSGQNAADGNTVYLPVEFRHVRIHGRIPSKIWSHARLVESEDAGILADIYVHDEDGRPIVEIRGVRCQAVDGGTREDLSDLTYEYKWQYAPRPGHVAAQTTAELLPSPTQILESTRAAAVRLDAELHLCEQVHRIQDVLDPLCRAFMRAAFLKLGSSMTKGERFTTAELVEALKIEARFTRLIDRSLEILCEDGSVTADGDGWRFGSFDRNEDPRARWREAVVHNPGIRPELMLVGRCGFDLAGVLRGQVDPVSLIFPEGSLALTEHLYQDSPQIRFDNTLAQRAVSAMVQELEPGRKLRILEIGGGTGGLSSYVLPMLPAQDTEYVFTDLSNHFFSRGAEKFRDYPFIEFKRLDIENDPCEQNFEAHSFDLILASHVLHATADIRETLANVKRLLNSRGILLMAETTNPSRWIDLVFGLTEGWWRFTDTELRPKHPLLSAAAWKDVLSASGFDDVCEASGGFDPNAHTAVLFTRGPQFDLGPSKPLEIAKPAGAAHKWLVFADKGGHADRLISELQKRGHHAVVVTRGPEYRRVGENRFEVRADDVESMKKLVRETVENESSPCKGIVHLWNLDAEPLASTTTDTLNEALTIGCSSVVFLCQALGHVDPDLLPRLWLITTEAETVGRQQGTSVTQAGAWGLNRVIINEAPTMRPTSIDMSVTPDDTEIRSLCDELIFDSNEDEIALRGDSRFVHRCMRQKDVADRHDQRVVVTTSSSTSDRMGFRLESGGYGMLDKLKLCKTERVAPKAGEVEIEVAAAGLNFSDVMKALGIYPGLPDGPVPLGIECSGRITAVGEGVTRFAVGDAVLAIGPFCFGSHVITPAGLAVPMPDGMRFEEAATIPIAFLTSYYSLIHLGRLQKGEKVLIHSATGGVGLSAIQIAQRVGAEIFATAGTEEKRELLRSLGIKHVMDSRSLDFAEEILEITNGAGVDVVLNSLAGEAIRKGLEVLGDFGRFLEIGKRDIYANTPIGLRPLRKNVSVMAIDLDRAMRRRPDILSSLFDELMEGFHDGSLRPFTYRVFPMSNVVSAFRHMAQAKHIGKVVVSVQEQEVCVAPASLRPTSFSDDATYLITGGLGGFGLVVAEWMVEMGARHLVLMGRSGASSQRARTVVARLEKLGAEVRVMRGDVSDPKDVGRILADIDATMPRLRGVLHAAMVLRDCLVVNLDQQMMLDVWGPKVLGAWNLHEQTKDRDLDLFVLFSSMSAIFGAGGQANYAAANTLLDSLAVHRRSQGLPGLSIAWGSLAEVGFVAEHADIAERFEKMGIDSFTPHQALALLGRFLQQESPHVAVMRVDWQRFIEHYGAKNASLRFKSLLLAKLEVEEEVETTGGAAVREALREAKPAERREMLESLLQSEVARVLGASPSELDVQKPLTELGLDSLMAVELKNWIECDLQLSLPTMALMRGPSVSKLSELLVKQLAKLDSRGSSGAPAEATG